MIRRHRRRDEGGAILILTSILALSLLTFTAYSVDIGHESEVKRHLHLVADTAAQDALYALGTSSALTGAVNYAVASASSNGHALNGSNRLSIEIGQWTGSPPAFQSFTPRCWVSLPGGATPSCAPAATANAVQVVASLNVQWTLMSGGQGLSATAVATPDGKTGLEAGSFDAKAGVTASQGQYLNAAMGITGVSYAGIAGANISLNKLASNLGFASPTAMLNGAVTFRQLISAAAQALSSTGDTTGSTNLAGIATALGAGGVGGASVSLANVFGVMPSATGAAGFGGGSVLAGNAGVDAMSLISGGLDASAINGTSFVSLNNVNLSIANVSSVDAGVKVVQAPGFGFGSSCGVPEPTAGADCAQATTAQLEGEVNVHLNPVAPILSTLGSITLTSNVPVYFDNAGAHAWVSTVSCTSPFDHQANVNAYAKTGLVHVALGQNSAITAATSQQDLTGGAGGSISIQGPDGVAVNVNGAVLVDVYVPGLARHFKLSASKAKTILGAGPSLLQPSSAPPPPAPASPSYSGAFQPATGLPGDSPAYRGPDTLASKSYADGTSGSPPTSGPTGNGLTDALGSLSTSITLQAQLDASMQAAGISVSNQTIIDAAVSVPLAAEQTIIQTVLSSLDSTVLAPISAALQASVAGVDVTNLAVTDQVPPNGTVCLPKIVQ